MALGLGVQLGDGLCAGAAVERSSRAGTVQVARQLGEMSISKVCSNSEFVVICRLILFYFIFYCVDWPMPATRTLTVETTGSRSSSNSSTISLNSPTIARHLPPRSTGAHSHSPLGPRSRKMSAVEHVRTVSDAGRFEKEFVEVEQVGSGEFGRVMKVRAKHGRGLQGDTVWAVKRSKPFEGPRHRCVITSYSVFIYPYLTIGDRLRLREEVDILAHLSARGAHSNVLTYVDSWEQDDALFIRTELCELGNFARFLWEYGRTFPRLDEARVWKIMVDLSNVSTRSVLKTEGKSFFLDYFSSLPASVMHIFSYSGQLSRLLPRFRFA